MPEEVTELKENAEHAKENPELAPVSLTMAILAVLVAVATLLGHRAHTEEVVLQALASDRWAYYQSQNIRRHVDELFLDLTSVQATANAAALAKLRDKYSEEATRYRDNRDETEAEARKLEAEVATERNRADRFDLSEVFLEIGLVITSITLLTSRKIYWAMGAAFAVVGVVLACTAWLIH
ncbi:MAG TPA: DUF4337 domain-containing protein [Candidatus Sulfotelmatobacter sp.]